MYMQEHLLCFGSVVFPTWSSGLERQRDSCMVMCYGIFATSVGHD